MLYHVITDGSLSIANGLMSCHPGQSEVITEVLQVDDAVLPGHGHLGSPSVGNTVGIVVSLLQAMNGADMYIVSFCNNQGTLLCLQSVNRLFPLLC